MRTPSAARWSRNARTAARLGRPIPKWRKPGNLLGSASATGVNRVRQRRMSRFAGSATHNDQAAHLTANPPSPDTLNRFQGEVALLAVVAAWRWRRLLASLRRRDTLCRVG